MLGFLKSLFTNPERDGQRLFRDAVQITEADRKSRSADYLQRAAELACESLAKLDARAVAHSCDREAFTYEIQQHHRDARQRQDYAQLTAMTLVLIHLRAKKLGDAGLSAIAVIDEFIANPEGHPSRNSDADSAQQ